MRRLIEPGMLSLLRASVCVATLAVVWAAAPVAAAQSSTDEFLGAHRAAVALNRPGVELRIRFKDGRATFNPREPITIELVFDLDPGRGILTFMPEDPCRGWPLAEVVIDPPGGVSAPQTTLCRDLAERIPGGVLGGVPGGSVGGIGGPPLPKPPPVVLALTVNDWHRFDRPGVYRLYVRSAHTTGDGSDEPRQTSNVLLFTIGARDAAYERERVAAITATLAASTGVPDARLAALRELRRLATEAAAPILSQLYPSSRDEVREADMAIAGLLMVPNRAAAVAALEGELRRPERPLTPGFIRDLASLEVARRGTPRPAAEAEYLTLVEHYAAERARALDTVSGRLEAAFRDDLREGGRFESRFYRGVLGPVAVRYPRQVMAAFHVLTAAEQRNLLTISWRRFADRAFVPLVRRLAIAPTGGDDRLRDIALRRWHDLAPLEARVVLRRELRRPTPRVSLETLGRLNERASPPQQRSWLQLLNASTDDAVIVSAAERLERFGTRAEASGVARAWQLRRRTWTMEASAATLAFLLRVEPDAGLALLRQTLADTASDRGSAVHWSDGGLLWRVGVREWSASLESIAIEALNHQDRAVRDDAARLLQGFGSAAARRPIEARLAVISAALARTANRNPVVGTGDADDPDDALHTLASALGEARGWTLSEADAEAWARRCPTRECRDAFRHASRHLDPSRTIVVYPPTPGAERDQRFFIDGVAVDGERALLDKVAQYPRGTRFGWSDGALFSQERERWTEGCLLYTSPSPRD